MSDFTNSEKEYDTEIGFNIVWKKKNADKASTTFIMSRSYKSAVQTLLKTKGGFGKIDILSIQEYDRESGQLKNAPVYVDDKDGIIYKMKEEFSL